MMSAYISTLKLGRPGAGKVSYLDALRLPLKLHVFYDQSFIIFYWSLWAVCVYKSCVL